MLIHMSTQPGTIEFVLEKLRDRMRFSARAMFGEYALYADNKVVALVCDDLVYVKIGPASAALETECEKGNPYPGASPHYIVEEGQFSSMHQLPSILLAIAAAAPARKTRVVRRGPRAGKKTVKRRSKGSATHR